MSENVSESVRLLRRLKCEASHLAVDSAQGVPIIRLGLIATLYFKDGHTPQVRQRLDACFARFHEAFRPVLKWQFYRHERKLTPSSFAACRRRILETSATEQLMWSVSSAPTNEVATCRLFVMSTAQAQANADRSCLKMVLPWSFLARHDGVKNYEDWLRYLCNQVCAEHGYSGLSCIFPGDGHLHFLPLEYRLAQEYVGLMVDPVPHIESLRLLERIKGVSWYTVLGDRFVKQLGGNDMLRRRLSGHSEVMFQRYENGLIVRAGALPELGTKGQAPPSAYVAVNKAIKSIRLQDTGSLHPYVGPGQGFNEETTARWYARFDEKPMPPVNAGQPCPQTGHWFSNATVRSRRFFRQGEIMPAFEHLKARKTQWFWADDE